MKTIKDVIKFKRRIIMVDGTVTQLPLTLDEYKVYLFLKVHFMKIKTLGALFQHLSSLSDQDPHSYKNITHGVWFTIDDGCHQW